MDRNEEGEGQWYRDRDQDDGDRERRFGRFGRWDEDRGRDDDRPRYQGWGGQSGSQAGGMSDNMYREQTGYRDRDMYRGQRTDFRGDERYGREMQQGYRSWGTGGPTQGRDYGGTFGGGHRGKGPAGYVRSDERIREDVCDLLTEDDHVDATHIEIAVKNGEVTLSGTVPDRRSKRMAEDIIERVPGIKDVTNHIRVQQDRDQYSTGAGSMGKSQSVSSSPERDADNGKRPRA